MKTVLMPIVVVRDGDKILLRKMDPDKSPYKEMWALFGGRIEDNSSNVIEPLNRELMGRWNFCVSIVEKLWWDEEIKSDHDGEKKRFIYLDAICRITDGKPSPVNGNEILEWVAIGELGNYDINPPTKILLQRLEYL